uniref:Uncharacterized protein n=1 Tax=Arundo donax TaxID=35708 RepID=A0A0A8YRX9_ARUDO
MYSKSINCYTTFSTKHLLLIQLITSLMMATYPIRLHWSSFPCANN